MQAPQSLLELYLAALHWSHFAPVHWFLHVHVHDGSKPDADDAPGEQSAATVQMRGHDG